MEEKVVIFTNDGQKFTFENNINTDICQEDKEALVYMEYVEEAGPVFDAFSYEDAIKLRDFLDWLIKKADAECEQNA